MKKLVSELIGAELDYWVGVAEGYKILENGSLVDGNEDVVAYHEKYKPSTTPAQGWPIIEREKIGCLFNKKEQCWFAGVAGNKETCHEGETSLIAAMRCYVASVYGESVDDE